MKLCRMTLGRGLGVGVLATGLIPDAADGRIPAINQTESH